MRHGFILTMSCTLFLTSACPPPSLSAADLPLEIRPSTAEEATTDLRAARREDRLADVLTEGLSACLPCIDVSAYVLSVGEITPLLSDLLNRHPELFHVAPRLGYRYDPSGRVLALLPEYTLIGEALTEARRLYREALDEFCVALCICRESRIGAPWSEADTVLYLHEWMVCRYAYDASGTHYDAYSLFRDGAGVCQAYALGFLALGQAAGLCVDVVTGAAMDHAWNHVCVGDAWYHVDVTRDDPVGDSGYVGHTHLLMSDVAADSAGYHDYACPDDHVCDSQYFDLCPDSPLGKQTSALLPLSGGWVSFQGGEAQRISPDPSASLADTATYSPADLLLLRYAGEAFHLSTREMEQAGAALRAALLDPPGQEALP